MAKLSLNPDPGFDINVAFNTMNKRLGELVNSGKMSLDQARAAQSEMRALQLNPAAANRQAATDIFQRHLQVGKYHPENVAAAQRAAERAAQQPQGGLTLAQPAQGVGGTGQSVNPVTPPQEIMVTPQRMPEIATMMPTQPSVMPPPPIRTYYDPEGPVAPQPPMPQPPMPVMPPPPVVYDTFRPETQPPMPVSQPQELPVAPTQPDMPERHSEYGIPLWMQLGAGPERDVAYAQYMKAQRGEMQPKFIGKNFTGDAPPPGKKYIETPEGLVPVPINDVPVKPAMGPGLGRALGMPMQGVGMAPQMPMPYNPINTTRLEDLRPGSGMGIGGILNALRNMQLPQGVGGMPRQGSPNALTIGRGPVPLDQQGPPLGGGIGAFLGRQGEAPQGGGMPPGVGMLRDQMAAMLNPQPRQGSFVDTMPKAIVDDNFRFGETTQQAPQNAQAMAMGGLLRKYYGGGMC